MDFGIRELLMFFGALICIGVLVDGVRRYQQNRLKQLKVKVPRKKNENESEEESIDWFAGELPGGGARIQNSHSDENGYVDQEGHQDNALQANHDDMNVSDRNEEPNEAAHTPFGAAQSRVQSGARNTRLEPTFNEPLDILMEPDVEFSEGQAEKSLDINAQSEQEFGIEAGLETDIAEQVLNPDDFSIQESDHDSVADAVEEDQNNDNNQGDLFGSSAEKNKTKPKKRFSSRAPVVDEIEPAPKESPLPEVVLSVNVIAKQGENLDGARLLELAESFGLRFGDMDIFHRHEHSTGQGAVIFSMASAVNPGTFNVSELREGSIKGVTFFMRLSELNKRTFVLELMVDIAKRLSTQLNAELKDDTHSVLSSQTVTHYKSRIQEYERRHLGQVFRK